MIVEAVKGGAIFIGRLGENEARTIRFPIREILNDFPGCTFTLLNRRPGDTDAYPSPNIAVNGDSLDWTVTSGDLVKVGFGECEIIASVNDQIVKSEIYQTVVKTALDGSGTVPEPWESWVTQVTGAAEQAEAAVEHYPQIEDGVWMVWDVENETWTSTGVQAEGQPGRDGQDGAPGAPGADGKDGKDGKDGQDGQDGAPGADGYSPTATVSKSGKIATITITDKNGTTTEQISDGEDGSGADIIDDTAGAGDTDKVWSADKSSGLLSAINVLEPSATASDIGKALIVKTVADGKATSYEYGEAGGGVDPQDIAEAVDAWCDENITNPDSPPLDRSLTASSAAAPADIAGGIVSKMQKVEIAGSENIWNKDDVETGLYYKNGTIYTGGSYDNYRYNSKKISVTAGDVLSFYVVNSGTVTARSVEHIACFDAEGTVNASAGISNTPVETFTIPSNIASVVINANVGWNNFMVTKNEEQAPTSYIPYREPSLYFLATEDFIPEEILRQYINDKVDKDGVGQVTGKNCEFVSTSPNLFNPATVETGLLNKSTGAVLPSYTNYVTSDWIEVEAQTDYTISAKSQTYMYWCWYNSSKEWISGGESNTGTKQSPANAKYIRFSITTANRYEDVQIEKGSTASSYMPIGSGYVKPEYMPPETVDITFNIPKKVYALVGYETNIYFENLVEDWTKYKWDVTCTKGMHLERGFRITPQETDVGTYTLNFYVYSGNKYTKFSTTLVVVSASAGSGVSESLIVLGDSTTANSIAVTKLNANLSSDVYSLSTIGTKGTAPNKHEGRSGWRFSTYFSNDADNAFYNPTSQTFDASYYFTNSGVSKPDWFFINLGINDVFGSTNDTDLDTAIDGCVTYCDSMIESILEASPNTKIGICLTIPPNHSQDAFGKEYKCGQRRDRYKRNNLLWVNALISEYDDREAEGIYLVPIYYALDTVYNMGFETIAVNARNTSITYESPIGNGGVHPVESGYWQIADVYTAFLKGNAT